MTRARALIRQFAQEQPIISHGNERGLGLGVLHPRGKPKTFSGILSVFPGNHFSTSHTNGASGCQCLQATINNPHSNQDAYEPSAVLIEHPRHPLQLYRKGIQRSRQVTESRLQSLLRWRPPPVGAAHCVSSAFPWIARRVHIAISHKVFSAVVLATTTRACLVRCNRSIRPSGQSKFYAWPRKPA